MSQQCVTGCIVFNGGERKHHRDCPYYPESLTKVWHDLEAKMTADNDRLRAVNAELLEALETIQAAFLSGDDSGHEWFIHDDGTLQEAIVAAIAKAKGDDHA